MENKVIIINGRYKKPCYICGKMSYTKESSIYTTYCKQCKLEIAKQHNKHLNKTQKRF